ncbi:MAG: ATP-dependent DNA helicase RecG, partial [Sphingomonadales bacterium]|nr:ATP-dependent DNA helicase RecG [Sphingomonadales bacterium]
MIDLLWHLPTGVVDRRAEPTIAGATPGTIATLLVRVLKHRPSPRGNTRAPYKVACEDDTGKLDLVFFHADHRLVERQLPVGSMRYISGRIEQYSDKLQMAHPDYIVPPERRNDLPLLEPVYPLTAGLSNKILQKTSAQALLRVPQPVEWQEPEWLRQRGWPDF